MTKVLEIKELIISFYKQFEKIINPTGKFLYALVVLVKLNGFLANYELLNSFIVNVAIAVLAAFIPGSWFVFILMGIVAGQLFFASIETTLIVTAGMLVIYLLFVRIFPKMAQLVIVVPLLFSLNLGYVVPIFAGLFLGPTSIIAISIGIMVYFFANQLSGLLTMTSPTLYEIPDTLMNMYKYVVDALAHDRTMILTIIIFAIVVIVTYIVSHFELDYIWYIAISTGGLVNILGFIIGSIALGANINLGGLIVGTIFGVLLCCVAQFMRFSLDYQRTDRVQFEDEDYYYYVKAIPKIKVTKASKQVKKIR